MTVASRLSTGSAAFVRLFSIWKIVVGLVFIFAATLKAFDSLSIARVLMFMGVPEGAVSFALFGLLAFEVALGMSLILWPKSRMVIFVAVTTLFAFTGVLAYLVFAENAPACGCLGKIVEWKTARSSNIIGIIRNLAILSVGVFLHQFDAFRARRAVRTN